MCCFIVVACIIILEASKNSQGESTARKYKEDFRPPQWGYKVRG